MERIVWVEGGPNKVRLLGEDEALSREYAWNADNLWTVEMTDHDWKRLQGLWPKAAKEFVTEASVLAAVAQQAPPATAVPAEGAPPDEAPATEKPTPRRRKRSAS